MIFVGLGLVAFVVASAGSAAPERRWGPPTYWIASAVSGVFVALGMPTIGRAIAVAVFTWVVSWFWAWWWTPLASRKGPDGRRKPGFASRYSYWPPRRPGTPPPRINRYSKPHYQARGDDSPAQDL
ncbi:hypothetical protein [Prescottella agglutinans]|uniref:Uncharacterized protein n=1 Tax=Prescottella agglutinans TaxID=1644129 RepID=A0ABT6MJI5_9NOCA|nr:hypothetical protein [Prescottella agglutinans]MDH6284075.1 hypothetical protein [Prescottella agglutinans]